MAARKDLGAYLASRGIDVQTATQEPPEQAVSQPANAAPSQAPARQAPRQAPQPTTSQFTTPEEYLQHRAQIKLGAQKPVQPNPVAPVQAPVQPQVAQGTELSAQISQATPQAAPQVSKTAVSPPAPAAAPPSTGVVPSPQPATERTTPGAGGIPMLGLRTAFEAGRNVGNLSMEVLPAGREKLFGDESPLTRAGRWMNNSLDYVAHKGKRVWTSVIDALTAVGTAPKNEKSLQGVIDPLTFLPNLAEKAQRGVDSLIKDDETVQQTRAYRALNALASLDDLALQTRLDGGEIIANLAPEKWREELAQRDDLGWLYKDQPWDSPSNVAENVLSIVDSSLNLVADNTGILAALAISRGGGGTAGLATGYVMMSALEGGDFLKASRQMKSADGQTMPASFIEQYAADYGAVSGAVEYVQSMSYLGKLLRGARKPGVEAVRTVWDKLKDTPFGKILSSRISQYATEGGEEVVQALTGYAIAQKMAADYEAQTGIKIEVPSPDLWDSFLKGAVVGGVLDVAGTVLQGSGVVPAESERAEPAGSTAQPALTYENLVPGTPDAERETQIPGQAVLRGAQEGVEDALEYTQEPRTGQRQGEVRVGGENAVTGLVENEVPAAETVAEPPQEPGTQESVNENLPDQVTPETIGSLIPRDENGNPASQQVGIDFTDRLAERFEGDPAELRRMADEVDQRIQEVSRDPEATTDQLVQAQRDQLEAQIYREVARKVEEARPQAEAPAEQAQAEQQTQPRKIEDTSSLDDKIQMLEDIIQTNKEMGRGINQAQLDKLAELKAQRGGEKVKGGSIASDNTVFGHPEATSVRVDKYGNLVPIKVDSVETVDRFMDRTQKAIDELQKKRGTAEARVAGRISASPKQKKEAKAYLSSANGAEDAAILDMLRNETMRELNRLRKELSKREEQQTPQAAPEQTEAAEPETPRRTRITKRGKEQGQGGFFSVPSFLKRTSAATGGVKAPVPPTDRQVQRKAREITGWLRREILPTKGVPEPIFKEYIKLRRKLAAGKLQGREDMARIESDVIEPLEDITTSDRIAEAVSWYMRGAMTEQEFRASFGTAGKTLTPGSTVDIAIGGEKFGTMKIDQNGNIVVQTGPNKLETYTPAELDAKVDQLLDTLRTIHNSNVARQTLLAQWNGMSEEMRERLETNDYYQTLMYERFVLGSRYKADPQAYQDAINLAEVGFSGAIEELATRATNIRNRRTGKRKPQMDVVGFLKTGDEALLTSFPDAQKETARRLREDYRELQGLILDLYLDPNTNEVQAQENTQVLLDAAQQAVDYYLTKKKPLAGPVGSTGMVNLKERTLNEIWRRLYIEIDDPGARQAKTAEVQEALLAQFGFWEKVREMGQDKVWSAQANPELGFTEKLGEGMSQRDAKMRYGNMAGMYVTKDLAELMGVGENSADDRLKRFAKMVWFVPQTTMRLTKLLWPGTMWRNYQSAYMGMGLQSGDVFLPEYHKHFKYAHDLMFRYAKKDPEAIREVKEIVAAGAFRHDLNTIAYDLDQSMRQDLQGAYGRTLRTLGAAYAFIDFPTKYASYMANIAAGKTSEEAAEHVELMYQNRDRIPKGLANLSKSGLGDYLAYPYDSVRFSVNAAKHAVDQMQKGNALPMLGFAASRAFYLLAFAATRDWWTDKVRRLFRLMRRTQDRRGVEQMEIIRGDREEAFRKLGPRYYEKILQGVWREQMPDGSHEYKQIIYGNQFAQSIEADLLGAAVQADSPADFGKLALETLVDQVRPGMEPEALTRFATGKELSRPSDATGVLELVGVENPERDHVIAERTLRLILDIYGAQAATPIMRSIELEAKRNAGQSGGVGYYYALDDHLDIWAHSLSLVRTYTLRQENMDKMVVGKIREKAVGIRKAKAMVKDRYEEQSELGGVKSKTERRADLGQRKRMEYLEELNEIVRAAQTFDSEWYSTKRLREILSDRDNGLSLSTDEIDALVRNRLDRIRPHVPQGYK